MFKSPVLVRLEPDIHTRVLARRFVEKSVAYASGIPDYGNGAGSQPAPGHRRRRVPQFLQPSEARLGRGNRYIFASERAAVSRALERSINCFEIEQCRTRLTSGSRPKVAKSITWIWP